MTTGSSSFARRNFLAAATAVGATTMVNPLAALGIERTVSFNSVAISKSGTDNSLQLSNRGVSVSKPPIEIETLIENHVRGFNTGATDLFDSVFGDTAIIIDGIAPYRWLNPNAPAKWLADVEKWRANLGVTHEHLSYKMGFWNVEGSYAYAVISGALSVTIKGQTAVRNGTLAYTFAKHGKTWKIEAQAWGRTS